jgi:hypothetical protein
MLSFSHPSLYGIDLACLGMRIVNGFIRDVGNGSLLIMGACTVEQIEEEPPICWKKSPFHTDFVGRQKPFNSVGMLEHA